MWQLTLELSDIPIIINQAHFDEELDAWAQAFATARRYKSLSPGVQVRRSYWIDVYDCLVEGLEVTAANDDHITIFRLGISRCGPNPDDLGLW